MSSPLLKEIKKEFNEKIADLKVNPTSYADVNDYAIKIGEVLTEVFDGHLTEMHKEYIREVLNDRLKANHKLIVGKGKVAQANLNQQANIGLAVQTPELNQDRIDGIVGRLVREDFEEAKWLLDAPIVNFSQSVVDDMIKSNAELHYRAGLSPKIIRFETGKCCKWCKSLAGIYQYPAVPKDVYRRHERCRCTVEFTPKKGVKQDVHSKKFKYSLDKY